MTWFATDLIRMSWGDYLRRECVYRGYRVRLSRLERDILSTLLLQRGRPVASNTLIEELWPDPWHEPENASNALRVHFYWLRRKLPGLILLWGGRRSGLGYLVALPTENALREAA